MEVILHTKKLGFIDMGIEQRNGAGLKIAILLSIVFLVCVQSIVESIALLVKFHCLMRDDFLVFEIECCILEHWVDFCTCF